MAKYKITFTIDAARKESVDKKLREAFGDKVDGLTWEAEKVKSPTNRSERLAEAEALVDDARSIVEELKDEMEQWRDSIPENLQGGEKYSEVETACDALDEIYSNLEQSDWGVEFPGMF